MTNSSRHFFSFRRDIAFGSLWAKVTRNRKRKRRGKAKDRRGKLSVIPARRRILGETTQAKSLSEITLDLILNRKSLCHRNSVRLIDFRTLSELSISTCWRLNASSAFPTCVFQLRASENGERAALQAQISVPRGYYL